jgi:hypothetical protein
MNLRTLVLVGTAAAIGYIAWSGAFAALALTVLMPALWAAAGTRWRSGAVVAAYQLAATSSLPRGIEGYYGTLLARGVVLWMVAALIVAGVWMALWVPKSRKLRALGVVGALFLTAFPPIGVVGWASPLTAAGVLFPGWGWVGLVSTVVVIEILALCDWRPLLLGTGVIVAWAVLLRGPAPTIAGWEGVNTCGGKTDETNAMRKMIELPRLMRSTSARVTVYPETVSGLWMPGEDEWWTRELNGVRQTVLVGAEVLEPDGQYANAVIEVNQVGSRVVYRQRMPVPLTMWRPWASDGARAYWFQNPVAVAAGKRAAVLICYEQTIVWPVLCSMAGRPDVVIACSNDWWCRNSAIPGIQRNSVTSWCRLFNVPLVMAVNR